MEAGGAQHAAQTRRGAEGAGSFAWVLLTMLVAGCTSRQDLIARMQRNYAAADYRAAAVDLRNLVRQEPGNVDFRLKLAESLERSGEFSDAEAQFTRARELGATAEAVVPGLTAAILGQGRYQDALNALDKARPVAGEDAPLLGLRAQALFGLGRVPEARDVWLKVLGKTPQNPAAHLGLAQVLIRLGDNSGAQAELDKAAEAGPEDFAVHLARGRWYAATNRASEAHAEFAKALELAQGSGKRSDTIAALALLGDAECSIPDLAAAEQHLQQLQQLAPQGHPTLLLQARLEAQTGRPDDAQATLKRLLARNPHDEAANALLGLIAARAGKPDTAETYLAQALSEQPGNLPVRRLLAETQLQQQQAGQALQTATDPRGAGDAGLLSLAGRASLFEGDVTGAVGYLERSERAAPSDKSRSLELAAGYLAAHRSADALALLETLEVPDALADRREWLLLAALADSGHTTQARAEALRFARARPEDMPALLIAADTLRALQDVTGGRALLAQAAALDPKAPQPWIQLGRLEQSQQNAPAAERALMHALELDPKSSAARLSMAQLDQLRGDTAGAVEELERIRTQDPRVVTPRVLLAQLYLASGQLSKSASVIAEAQGLVPENPDVRHIGALLALAQGRDGEAATVLERLARQFPNAARVQADLARAYLVGGRLIEARGSAEAALRADPEFWPALVTEVACSLAQRDLHGAESLLERLRHTHAPEAAVLEVSGDVAAHAGSFADALKAFSAADTLRPSGPLAIKMFAVRLALHTADPDAPLRDWLQRVPSDVLVRLALAQRLQADGQQAAAAKEYETVLGEAPGQLLALNNLAWLKVENGDAQEGLELAHRAYDLGSGLPAVADTYGWALIQSGHAEAALPLLRNAYGRLPGDNEIRYHLGVALVKTGALEEGRQQLQVVADSTDHGKVSEQARALLARLGAGGKG